MVRENEALPPGRCRDDGDGGLEIRSVEARDSGVYICVARLGSLVNMARANLTVSDTEAGPRGISQPSVYSDPRMVYPGNSAPAVDRREEYYEEDDEYDDSEVMYEDYGDPSHYTWASCGPEQFECGNQAQCVPLAQRCDGEFDCTDGSDENEC